MKIKTSALLLLFLSACTTLPVVPPAPTPTPAPVATPTPSPAPTPSPSPAQNVLYIGPEKPEYAPAAQSSASLFLARNEVTGFFVSLKNCDPLASITPAGITVSLFAAPTVTTTKSSASTIATGVYHDPLPALVGNACGYAWIDVSVGTTVAPGNYSFTVGDLPVTLVVNSLTMPASPSLPVYVGLEPTKVFAAHGLPSTANVVQQMPVLQLYLNALRADRLEPMTQTITLDPPLGPSGAVDVDHVLSGLTINTASFRQTNMTGSIAPVCLRSPTNLSASWASASVLKGWNLTIPNEPLLANSWFYLTDEPNATDATAANPDIGLTGTAARAQLVRTNAPLAKTMVTHEPAANLLGLIDRFTVVFEYFKQPGHWTDYAQAPGYWLYGSCMSHGCGSGALTGTPDLMLDELDVNARQFPLVAYALGAQAALYYDAVYNLKNAWNPDGQFYSGGQGDGTLFYPGVPGSNGLTASAAVESVRTKSLRQGQYDAEYFKLKPSAFAGVVTDQFNWTKSHALIDAARRAAVQ